jgi:hypothetical protein
MDDSADGRSSTFGFRHRLLHQAALLAQLGPMALAPAPQLFQHPPELRIHRPSPKSTTIHIRGDK